MVERKVYRQALDWDAFLDACRVAAPEGTHETSKDTKNARWAGTPNYEAALELGARGWSEGLSKMNAAGTALALPTVKTPTMRLDVAGAYPIAAMAAAGEMACMVDRGFDDAPRGTIRIVVGGFMSSGNTKGALFNRAAVLCALIDAIETSGRRAEVVWALYCEGFRPAPGEPNPRTAFDVMLKAADQPLDRDRMAFALAHPSMFRRLGFRLIERFTPQRKEFPTYGQPCSMASKEYPDAIICPGLAYDTERQYATPEAARETILGYLAKAGVELELEGA